MIINLLHLSTMNTNLKFVETKLKRFGDLTRQAMKLVEKELNVQCPLDSEYKIGKNWYETH